MHWQRLDRDSSLKVIDSVKSAADMGLFNIGTSEVTRAFLPFYKDFFLFKVTNFASLPSFSFEYIGDGTFFHYLDGTAEPIYSANDKGKLELSEATLIDYLVFYYSHVAEEDLDEITVIKDPHDMPLLDSLDPEAFASVMRSHKPATITPDNEGGYMVETEIYTEGQLLRAKMSVSAKGRVTMREQKMITNNMVGAQSAPIY